jgi:MFS superfamily sulfate permease-like transporter
MKTSLPPLQIESRWPIAVTILVLLVLLTVLPDRIRFLPVWVPYMLGISLLVSMATVRLTGAKARWLRFEHITMLVFCTVVGVTTVVGLTSIMLEMAYSSKQLSGLQLEISK